MGMDQYVWTVENSTGDEFPLRQWRKFYALENAVEQASNTDVGDDCVIRVELNEEIVLKIKNNLIYKSKLGTVMYYDITDTLAFFDYLLYHMRQYTDVDYETNIVTPKYTYYYGADW